MVDWSTLLLRALLNGASLSLALTTVMLISGVVARDMWVGDYPPDVQEKYGPMSPRAARLRPFVALAFFLTALLIPLAGLFGLGAQAGSLGFLAAFAFACTALLFFNVFDLLVLDWLLFCTIQPSIMVLPGTAGMAGYRNYRVHFIGFLKGLGFSIVSGLVIAALWTGLQALLP